MTDRPPRRGPLARSLRAMLAGPRPGNVSLPPGTQVEKNVRYGADPAQCLDVYAPTAASAAPIFVLVHGGAWFIGDKARPAVVEGKVARWVPRGCIVVSVNYRLMPRVRPIDQADDLGRAVALIQTQAVRWGGDAGRVVLIGHSTGAWLAAMLSADAELAGRHGVRPWLGSVLLDSAALNLVDTMSRPHRPLYDHAFGDDPSAWAAASPWHRLSAATVPMLLMCSRLRDESCAQAQAFAARANALGGHAQVVPVALGHADINRELGDDETLTADVERFFRGLGLTL